MTFKEFVAHPVMGHPDKTNIKYNDWGGLSKQLRKYWLLGSNNRKREDIPQVE